MHAHDDHILALIPVPDKTSWTWERRGGQFGESLETFGRCAFRNPLGLIALTVAVKSASSFSILCGNASLGRGRQFTEVIPRRSPLGSFPQLTQTARTGRRDCGVLSRAGAGGPRDALGAVKRNRILPARWECPPPQYALNPACPGRRLRPGAGYCRWFRTAECRDPPSG